jgi:hypothetical protein
MLSPTNSFTSADETRFPRLELDYPPQYPFQEEDKPENIQVDSNHQIQAGTLPKIIERLTHHLFPGKNK